MPPKSNVAEDVSGVGYNPLDVVGVLLLLLLLFVSSTTEGTTTAVLEEEEPRR